MLAWMAPPTLRFELARLALARLTCRPPSRAASAADILVASRTAAATWVLAPPKLEAATVWSAKATGLIDAASFWAGFCVNLESFRAVAPVNVLALVFGVAGGTFSCVCELEVADEFELLGDGAELAELAVDAADEDEPDDIDVDEAPAARCCLIARALSRSDD